MLSAADHHDLTKVGPGTVMGSYMREYWLPAIKSTELVKGIPLRVMLLGEKLIAFRKGDGSIGVVQHQCPHRCTSLFLGRVEDDGIRCINHGWKFDGNGNCTEMPNVKPEQDYKEKVKITSYPARERGGVVWVYMGTGEPPMLPPLESNMGSKEEMEVIFALRNCNYLQAMEGDLDNSHFEFLHMGHVKKEDIPPGHWLENTIGLGAPTINADFASWGTMCGAARDLGNGQTYYRFVHFVFPFFTLDPADPIETNYQARAYVPMDDEHTMFISFRKKNRGRASTDGGPVVGMFVQDFVPNGTGWFERFRSTVSEDNDWSINRMWQTSNTIWSGLDGIWNQDQAVAEAMGPIADHTKEHLGPSDLMIIKTRQALLNVARACVYPCRQGEYIYEQRGGFFTAPTDVDWRAAYFKALESVQRIKR
jgi:phenylpropionate dioxygenase-like ring-hydroxylating dioxygenase large terminal subunit